MNELQRRLGPRGLVVLGFPCNQFGHQVRGAERAGVAARAGLGALPSGRRPQPHARGAERPPQARFPPALGRAGVRARPGWCKENGKNEEILNSLKYVRPGGGFEPNFTLFEKCEVNGAQAHPLFVFLRQALPAPSDDPTALMTDPKFIIWSPVCRNDVSWNFEKFLVGRTACPCAGTAAAFPPLTSSPT
ncbi:hypothetical protein QTO34_007376 [Cnephaeus nilssonii]|uniref:Glutathione peroxidase 1 n=1 Tax=Cnephaeus nilssonii TaxID=3371016 RepID=A0AA40HK52_CNENI|nr:hypothetical protein QTO34_007376 [Eptesicus nilssonii]